ncbi:DUF4923 family protein [Cytophagales bacterium LB-30]|uniref:DUF4923 family protein n=1 Tax=Shiella aurantiaca TaxID=3058365 RepID=A0ABT8F6M8_9BACT|nr:DUF4923 family protein [Shiella aurantiaca]MDN4165881.1 DUF4923 family protein [Shiella aurantiaca]
MKKIYLFAFTLIGLSTFSACNNDEEKETAANAALVGTWEESATTFEYTINDQSLVDYLVDELDLSEAEAEAYANLLEDVYGELLMSDLTVTFNSNNTYSSTVDGETGTGTYALSADKKTITLDAGTQDESVMSVKSLTATQMVVAQELGFQDDLNEDGTDEDILVSVEMTLTKK